MDNLISSAPALRVAVPLAVGIALTGDTTPLWVPITVMAVAVTVLVVMRLLGRRPERRHAMLRWWWMPLCLAAMALGSTDMVLQRPPRLDLQQVNGQAAKVHIDMVERNDFSMRVGARITDIGGKPLKRQPHIMITTRGCDYRLTPGYNTMLMLDLSEIAAAGNPDEVDYPTLMLHRGIRYRQHLGDAATLMEHGTLAPTWLDRMAMARHQLVERLLASHTSAFTQSVVAAMLVGDTRLLDSTTRQEFSQAGVAHVLALSGLHVGAVAWMVWLLLFPLDHLRLRRLRLCLTIVLVAAFAVFTGLSPSVVRATLMIATALLGEIALRRHHAINSLAVAAIVLLVAEPVQLFGPGFQLSFLAMAALLVVSRHSAPPSGGWLLSHVKSALIATAVATIATLMISAHYFHTVPLLSLPANLLVLPMVPVAIALGALQCLSCAAGIELMPLSMATDAVCRAIGWVTEHLAALPAAHIGNVYVSVADEWVYTAVVVLLAWWLMSRRRCLGIAAAVGSLMLWGLMAAERMSVPTSGVMVLNEFGMTPVFAYNGHEAVLWIPDGNDDADALRQGWEQRHTALLARRGITHVACSVDSDMVTSNMVVCPPRAMMCGVSFTALSGKRWQHDKNPTIFHTDVLLLTTTFGGSTRQAVTMTRPTIVVSAAELPPDSTANLGIGIHNLRTDGAWQPKNSD